MKRIISFLFISIMLVGCSAHKPMEPAAMYTAPDFSKHLPENITVIRLKLNPLLDVADTAFYPDLGLSASTTWPYYLCPPGHENMKEAKEFMVVRLELDDGQKIGLVFLPEKLEKFKAWKGGMTDHAGKRFYGPDGQMAYVPDWETAKIKNFEDIIKPVGEMKTIEAAKGSREYEDLLHLLEPFKAEAAARFELAKKITNDYMKSYGIPIGTSIDDAQMKVLLNDQSFQERMVSLLTDNWYGAITYPLWTPEQYGLSIIISKVFQIPTKFWDFDINRPGYMDRKLTAIQGGAMIDHYDLNYGFKSYFSPEDVAALQEMLEKHRGAINSGVK
jgi:hypothetical protein